MVADYNQYIHNGAYLPNKSFIGTWSGSVLQNDCSTICRCSVCCTISKHDQHHIFCSLFMSISGQPPQYSSFFSINPITGQINLLQQFRRSEYDVFVISVAVSIFFFLLYQPYYGADKSSSTSPPIRVWRLCPICRSKYILLSSLSTLLRGR